jgi:hypothetical protein
MKKQKTPRKLEIQRETLLLLDRETLEHAQGGGHTGIEITSDQCPN